MSRHARALIPVMLLLAIPAFAQAQQSDPTVRPTTALKSMPLPSPGPLTISSLSPAGATIGSRSRERVPAAAYQYARADWEFGRAWLGAIIGTGIAYIGDLVIHYNTDFSKGNMMLNEKDSAGEITYNVLLYGGITPYYAMRGVHGVTPYTGSKLGSYALGAVGSILGLFYWTERGEVQDVEAAVVLTGLTALGAQLGYHIFSK